MRKTLTIAIITFLPAFIPASAKAQDAYVPPAGLSATDITFINGDTTLHGSVVRRQDLDPKTRHPAIILVHGSGPGHRGELGQEAEVFARAGLVTLIYDKRSDYSKTHRDFSAMADDALAGVRALTALSDVDPARTGMWGLSEGGWVAPLAASRSPEEVRFLVTIGASGLTPARTQAWNLGNRITRAGVTPSTVDAIVRTGMGMAIATDSFPQADYDPVPALRAIRRPVLAIWGELDTQVPPRESAEVFGRELTASPSASIRVLPHGAHAGRVTTDGYDRVGGPTVGGFVMGELLPGYGSLMTGWILGLANGTPAAARDALPAQARASTPVTAASPLWWLGFAVIVLALASWPVWAVVRRIRGRRGRPVGAHAARGLVIAGLASVIGGVTYAIMTIAGSGKNISGYLMGQPLPWLLLRVAVVAALVCAVMTGLALRAATGPAARLRLAATALGGLLLVPFAFSLGLLLP